MLEERFGIEHTTLQVEERHGGPLAIAPLTSAIQGSGSGMQARRPHRPRRPLLARRPEADRPRSSSAYDLTDWAAALTYFGVLSLFPGLLALRVGRRA